MLRAERLKPIVHVAVEDTLFAALAVVAEEFRLH